MTVHSKRSIMGQQIYQSSEPFCRTDLISTLHAFVIWGQWEKQTWDTKVCPKSDQNNVKLIKSERIFYSFVLFWYILKDLIEDQEFSLL